MRLKPAERLRILRLLADRSRRTTIANLLNSRLLRWRYGPPTADQLIILPQDLRTADPSFWSEISVGHFGLAGAVAFLSEGSPFDLKPPSPGWSRELHGFGWLRHLDAARNDHAKAAGVRFVLDWIGRNRARGGVAWEPAVTGRRIISWISHAGLLLEGQKAQSYDAIASSLGEQIVLLSSAWRHAHGGYDRLLALSALVLADLCVADHDRQLESFEALLSAEIDRQILPDGGHVSRNPGLLVELLLDFLPLSQCFVSRSRTPPKALVEAIHRMLPMVRFMRLGDGALARFNGMGAPTPDALATVLAYEGRDVTWPVVAPQSRYARLTAGDTVAIVDVGPPPALELAGQAHAGCLSFELSTGARSLFVNGGAPGPADPDWRAASRATASHSTLCLANRSSARLVRSRMLEELIGAAPIRFPQRVTVKHGRESDGRVWITAGHDGYLAETGLIHTRTLTLSADGRRLDGRDRLEPPHGVLRLKRDEPFAVHFHLSPQAGCRRVGRGGPVLIELAGATWAFAAEGAAVEIEESAFYADFSGPRRTLQIVLRGATFGSSDITWSLAAVEARATGIASTGSADAGEPTTVAAEAAEAESPTPLPLPAEPTAD